MPLFVPVAWCLYGEYVLLPDGVIDSLPVAVGEVSDQPF